MRAACDSNLYVVLGTFIPLSATVQHTFKATHKLGKALKVICFWSESCTAVLNLCADLSLFLGHCSQSSPLAWSVVGGGDVGVDMRNAAAADDFLHLGLLW